MALAEPPHLSASPKIIMEAVIRGERRKVTWHRGVLEGDTELVERVERMHGGTPSDPMDAIDAVQSAVGGTIVLKTETD